MVTAGPFVAPESAFVEVRPTQVNALVERGEPGSKLVPEALEYLDEYRAVSQLGITLSPLGLGWIGEPAVAPLTEFPTPVEEGLEGTATGFRELVDSPGLPHASSLDSPLPIVHVPLP